MKILIDGKEVIVREGESVLTSLLKEGIEIPNLCYDERLSPYASCRLCLVEIEERNGFVPACTTIVEDGMKIKTNTERLSEIRRQILELILSNHPDDCLLCEKSGNCKLQDYAYQYGVRREKYKEKMVREKENRPYLTNPFIERDPDKCILCGRCVRICDEIMGRNVLDFANRGFSCYITTGLDRPIEESNCEFCGQCISSCPVGALTSRIRKKARTWEINKIETICPYCGCGCKIILKTRDNTIIDVSSPLNALNNGNLCIKGRFGFDFVNHKDRLKTPLIKKDGRFKEVGWDEALELVAKRLSQIKEKYGQDAIGGIASAKVTNEENYLFQKFMRVVIGTNNVDHCARLCHGPSVAALAKVWGSGAMTNTINDIKKADCIIIIGSNTTSAHPIVGLSIKEAVKNGTSLIVIDPRKIEFADIAHIWLRQIPGTDVCVLNGLTNVILNEGLYKKEFIERRTEGFEGIKEVIEKYNPEYVEEISGVKKEDLIEAARLYAKADKGCIVYSMGITQHTTGTDNVLCLANLVMLTGNVGKEGTGLNPLRGQNNVQGACDMGALPNLLSGYQRVNDENIRKKFGDLWKVNLPEKLGQTLTEMVASPDIKALYIMGANPLVANPDVNNVREELEKKEFIIVQDIFLTETGGLADVILPSCSFAEKDGTFTNTERRIQLLNKAIEPIGDSKPDWRIICELAKKINHRLWSIDYGHPSEIMAEISLLTPQYGGINYERLKNRSLHWPCPSLDHPGTPILHKEKFTRGLGLFCPVEYKPPAEEPDDEYPFILTTGRIMEHYHTGSMTRRCKGLDSYVPNGFVEINLKDAEKIGIKNEEIIKVSSRRGLINIKAKITNIVPEKTLFIPFHFAEQSANALTNSSLDPIAKMPELKVCAAKIEKSPGL